MDAGEHPAVSAPATLVPGAIPPWIRTRVVEGENFKELKQLVQSRRLHTVCEEAKCPNIFDCWSRRALTSCLSSLKFSPSTTRVRIHGGIAPGMSGAGALTAGCSRVSIPRGPAS